MPAVVRARAVWEAAFARGIICRAVITGVSDISHDSAVAADRGWNSEVLSSTSYGLLVGPPRLELTGAGAPVQVSCVSIFALLIRCDVAIIALLIADSRI